MYLYKAYTALALILCCSVTYAQEYRTFDGSNNHLDKPLLGASHTQLDRASMSQYADGISAPNGEDRLNPRIISNKLFKQTELIDNTMALSDYIWVFGQFLDHDVSLVESYNPFANPEEALVIVPPADDEHFGPGEMIFMSRSQASEGTGTDVANPRQHDNAISSYIDASNIYGSDIVRANWLRTFENGKLKVSQGDRLPWNTVSGQFNDLIDEDAPAMDDELKQSSRLFVAGDPRANENPLLISIHTLFVREHNRLCDELKSENPFWSDEELYQHARKLVGGFIQSIVYNEWLPAQGIHIPAYVGYNSAIDPSITNVFSAAAFRMGHTLINSSIIRMMNDGEEHPSGYVELRDAFFNPAIVALSGGIEPFLKGMATQKQQDLDCKVIDDVRNFLFDDGAGGLDLAAININRGRERGIPDYNQVREDFGLPRVTSFSDICEEDEINTILEDIYGTVDDVDAWVGMLAEDHMNESIFGELIMTIMERQFRSLRDGDRFYFENDADLSEVEKEAIRNTSMHDIIMRNTDISLMQYNVFTAMPHQSIPNGPELQPVELDASVYPNPIGSVMNLKVYSEEEASVAAKIYDIKGILVMEQQLDMLPGENFFTINWDQDLLRGVYHLYLENDSGTFNIKKLIKE